jgi:hypothetical protein
MTSSPLNSSFMSPEQRSKDRRGPRVPHPADHEGHQQSLAVAGNVCPGTLEVTREKGTGRVHQYRR